MERLSFGRNLNFNAPKVFSWQDFEGMLGSSPSLTRRHSMRFILRLSPEDMRDPSSMPRRLYTFEQFW